MPNKAIVGNKHPIMLLLCLASQGLQISIAQADVPQQQGADVRLSSEPPSTVVLW